MVSRVTRLMIVASSANAYVGFFASGISLLRAIKNMFGTTWATGSTEDFCQVKLIYDNTDQWGLITRREEDKVLVTFAGGKEGWYYVKDIRYPPLN